ncbi:MAG: Acyl-CoA synthetase clustered with carnitinyl-CoA dehydratase [uncultured Nocardioidaceae bacterium]|uniref:Acyl-CoA synthetase clustered with carnitinyl-CoA dehydratase n=1 Tax=uncultured Nocardioidaceae bacterium TaxID=253824 RepID=A0A6J4LD08_9ACTN|nr:MAG: Acyl-CoA synthetase clustered with carnitinyl-CoA dehydratase [uncultured Nocardioidaceae bacterium]
MTGPSRLGRLLAPGRIAVIGGEAAEEVVLASRAIGYAGEIWPVHPTREYLAGLPCVPDVASLPAAPDAAFVAVSRERTVQVVAELARIGTGGVVCHASGFAEAGGSGPRLQQELVAAAGPMPLLGPNCLGLLNYLDGAALWADQHGGVRVSTGVGLIAQSGNIGQNLTMQQRGLPVAQLVTLGNSANTGVPDVLEAMLQDPRITAVGLYLESIPDPVALARVAGEALRRRVPVVALKAGSSQLGAQATLGHTASVAGPDALFDALFRRLGFARVHELATLLETLKVLHVHGGLPGARITSASCSGGEAAHVADLAVPRGVELPVLPVSTEEQLRKVLGERVDVRNPLDYHTYIWGDLDALTSAFTELLSSAFDCHLLVLDLPREDRCDPASWRTTVDAFIRAQQLTGARAAVVSSLPEGMPEPLAQELFGLGIVPLQGIGDALSAIEAAARIGACQAEAGTWGPPYPPAPLGEETVVRLDEAEAKAVLAATDVRVPAGTAVPGEEAGAAADSLGYPVVVKVLSPAIAHKTDVAGVEVGLQNRNEVESAVDRMRTLGERFLVEEMVTGAVAELLVSVRRDPHVGLVLTIGAGGVLVEVLRDAASLLLPTSRHEVLGVLAALHVWPLLIGARGRSADLESLVTAVLGIAECARDLSGALLELEVNPLIVCTDRAVAADALLRMAGTLGPASGSGSRQTVRS